MCQRERKRGHQIQQWQAVMWELRLVSLFFIFQNEYRKYIKMLKELLQVGRNQSTPKWILSKKVLASTMPPYTRSYQQKLKKNRCALRSCLHCYETLVLCQETNSSIEDDPKLQLSFFEIELVSCIPNSPHDNGLSLEFLLAQFVYHTPKQSKKKPDAPFEQFWIRRLAMHQTFVTKGHSHNT